MPPDVKTNTGNICCFSGSQKWKWGVLRFDTAVWVEPLLWEAPVFVRLSLRLFVCLLVHVCAPPCRCPNSCEKRGKLSFLWLDWWKWFDSEVLETRENRSVERKRMSDHTIMGVWYHIAWYQTTVTISYYHDIVILRPHFIILSYYTTSSSSSLSYCAIMLYDVRISHYHDDSAIMTSYYHNIVIV